MLISMEHPENSEEYKGLTVNQGVEQPSIVNPYLSRFRKKRTSLFTVGEYVEGILKGDISMLSQAVTLVESVLPEHQAIAQEVIEKCLPHTGGSVRIGISGVPGAGKSTSIDDFGTGYSSLNMLKMTSIDILKIDKSFIPFDSEDSQKDKACIMFESIARLAGELGVMVVAEGVETEQQYEYLTGMGCDIIQGYYFDKPLPEEEFLEKVKMAKY